MSADLKVCFGSGPKPKSTPNLITVLNATPAKRNVRAANTEETERTRRMKEIRERPKEFQKRVVEIMEDTKNTKDDKEGHKLTSITLHYFAFCPALKAIFLSLEQVYKKAGLTQPAHAQKNLSIG